MISVLMLFSLVQIPTVAQDFGGIVVGDHMTAIYHDDGSVTFVSNGSGEDDASEAPVVSGSLSTSSASAEPIYAGADGSETTCVAKIGDAEYTTLAGAITAANEGDTITVIGNISDETVTVKKSVTITGDAENKATLNNVKLTISGTTVKLTVSDLSFTGDSYINAGDGAALTVTNVDANVTPTKVGNNARAAFIVTGTNEPTHGLLLEVQNCTIIAKKGDNTNGDFYAAAIFGWRYLADGTTISNNTFGSEEVRYTFIAVKTMNAMNGATITVKENTVYGTNQNWKFKAFDLYQNCSRDNTYTVRSENNHFHFTEPNEKYNAVAFYLEGNGGTNLILLENGSTVNGEALTMDDVDASDLPDNYDQYYGINVQLDDARKIVSGTFGGNTQSVDVAASVSVSDSTYTTYYQSFAEAIAEANEGDTVTLLADIRLSEQVVITKGLTIDGAGHTIKATEDLVNSNNNKRGMFYRTGTGGNLIFKDITLDGGDVSKIYLNENGSGETVFNNVTATNGGGGAYGNGIHISGGNSTVRLINSKVTGNNGNKTVSDGYAYVNDLWIGDGNIKAYVDNSIIGKVFVNSNLYDNSPSASTLYISGNETEIDYLCTEKEDTAISKAVISGGHVTTLVNRGTYEISGGTFDTELLSTWCATGFTPTVDENGKYTVTTATGEILRQMTLSLEGQIGIKLYFDMSGATFTEKETYLVFTIDGKEIGRVAVTEDLKGSDGLYEFECKVDATQMASTITLYFATKDENGTLTRIEDSAERTTSVKYYADYILELVETQSYAVLGYTKFEQLQALGNLVAAMLNYGGNAEKYFGASSAAASADLNKYFTEEEIAKLFGQDPTFTEADKWKKLDPADDAENTENPRFTEATVDLQSQTVLRFYFTLPEDADLSDYTFQIQHVEQDSDGTAYVLNTYTLAEYAYTSTKDDKTVYYVDISNIPAAYLNNAYRLTILDKKGTEEYTSIETTVMWYADYQLNNENSTASDTLKALLKSMYWYNYYADVFFGA